MDSVCATASSSREENTSDNVESKFYMWGAWKECERMLIANSYMLESQSVKMSPKIVQIANEMYTRITRIFDEMELIEDEEFVIKNEEFIIKNEELPLQNEELPLRDEELPLQNEELPLQDEELPLQNEELPLRDENIHYVQTSSNAREEDSDWEAETTTSKQRDFISLEYKRKVVELAKAHPKWSLKSLQKRGASLLRRKSHLKIWEAEVAAGGTVFYKYEEISKKTFQRFQEARENLEQITSSTLQRWALMYARELNCDQFVASNSWIIKFKKRYGISQRKIARHVSTGEVAPA